MGGADVVVELGARSYPVRVREDWADLAGSLQGAIPGRVVLVTDERVEAAWGAAVRARLEDAGLRGSSVVLPAGEAHKTVATWERCVEAIVSSGADRGTTVIALGGGVLGDIAGFAAATALRGLAWIQLPTTLLAMVDASVGGKTGVNLPGGKNLVGSFHQPRLVYAALEALRTLDPAEARSGLGEVVKHALVADRDLLEAVEGDAPALGRLEGAALAPVVARCVRLKAGIVGLDEREAGPRSLLNAGHTAGHALERAAPGRLRHGEAVLLGLVAEARLAIRLGLCEEDDLPGRILDLGARLGLPVRTPPVDRNAFRRAVLLDKKRIGDSLRLPVPRRAGHAVLVEVPADSLAGLFEALP